MVAPIRLLRDLVAFGFETSNDFGTFCYYCAARGEDSPEWKAVKAHNAWLVSNLESVARPLPHAGIPPSKALQIFAHEDSCLWAQADEFIKALDG